MWIVKSQPETEMNTVHRKNLTVCHVFMGSWQQNPLSGSSERLRQHKAVNSAVLISPVAIMCKMAI